MGLEIFVNGKVVITGATGFVGSALIRRLQGENLSLCAAVREGSYFGDFPKSVECAVVQPLSARSDYSSVLRGAEIVVHLAARTHVLKEKAEDPLQEFRRENVQGTVCLARQAFASGVRRFVFISSVKVNGEGRPNAYTEEDPPKPEDAYGISKNEAEVALRKVSAETGLEVVIIRPPLVYGPGVKANFLRLLRAVYRGSPLPFASIRNRRSFIFVGNLVDVIAECLSHPKAQGQTYLVSDGDDVSTPELVRCLSHAMGKPAWIFPLPGGILKLFGSVSGNSNSIDRLLNSLMVDMSKIRRELDWNPPYTFHHGLRETTEWFINHVACQR